MKQYYFVIRELVGREIKRKYARSFLGIIWSVLNPLLSMAVMSMIFTTIFKRSIENFPVYYLTGQIFWSFFSTATNSAMTALVDNRTLLLKVKLPKQTFVLARIYTALTNFGYTCVAYVLMLLVFRIKPSIYMIFLIVDVVCMLLFAMGIGYILSILYVFFADIKYLYSVFLTLLMYLSAVFYPLSSLPENMQNIISWNPIYIFIEFSRVCVMNGEVPDTRLWTTWALPPLKKVWTRRSRPEQTSLSSVQATTSMPNTQSPPTSTWTAAPCSLWPVLPPAQKTSRPPALRTSSTFA